MQETHHLQVKAHHHEESYISDIVGPYAWGVIHHAVESFPCPSCAEEGESLMHFAHDLVNHQLGKPIQHPGDLKRWAKVTLEAAAHQGVHAAHSEVYHGKQPIREHENMMLLGQNIGMHSDHEIGAPICRTGDTLRLGDITHGEAHSVSVPLRCPGDGVAVGTFHTHPGGDPSPSPADINEAHRLGLQVLCIGTPNGQTTCRRL